MPICFEFGDNVRYPARAHRPALSRAQCQAACYSCDPYASMCSDNMNRTAAVDRLRALSGPLTAMGMRALYLFGSTARDETGPASDLDLFIDYDAERNFSLIELAGLQIFLEEQLHVPVDITTRDSLHPLLRPEIERTATRVF